MASAIAVLDDDPFERDTLASPYRWHERLRAAGPIVWLARYSTYCTGRHHEVDAILRDWRTFTSTGGPGLSDMRRPGSWRAPGAIVEADPPQHSALRGPMNKILSPRLLRGWRDMFDRAATAMLNEVLGNPAIDAVTALAEPYILRVFPDALGLRTEQRSNLLVLGNHGFNALGPPNDLFRATEAQMTDIAAWTEANHRRDRLAPGGFGEQVFAAEDAGELPAGSAALLLRTLLRGGLDTTIAAIGSLIWLLARNPDQWRKLKQDPSLVGNAFEEAVRLETPIQSFYRTTVAETGFAGVVLPGNVKVHVYPSAANRDPTFWQNADVFDVERKVSGHLAFGAGIHNCIGKLIAKFEAESLMPRLVERVRSIELDGPVEYLPNNTLRMLKRLPIKLVLEPGGTS